jgi:hypothetical protein
MEVIQMERSSNETHDYEIKVRGHLCGRLARAFEELQLTLTPDGHTVISGTDVDQSALFGVLIRIRDCGLPLVAVVRQKPVNGWQSCPETEEKKDV